MERLFIIDFDADKAEKRRMYCQLMAFLGAQSESGNEQANSGGFPHKSKRTKFFAIYLAMFAFFLYDRGVWGFY